jgi:hypothetical protein
MESIHFYKPIELLMNTILTGQSNISFVNDKLLLKTAYISSILETKNDHYNIYFLSCIEQFLKDCDLNDREKLFCFFIENDIYFSGVYFLNDLDENAATETLISGKSLMLTEFVQTHKLSKSLILTLYFYIENSSKVKIVDNSISREEYHKILEFNSKKRDFTNIEI